MNDLVEMQRQGLSIQEISSVTGIDRKTVRRYLKTPEAAPRCGPRPRWPSKLDEFKPYLEERMKAGVWNARVLMRELRARGYNGGYTILTDWLHPQRQSAGVVAVRRFETPPGRQAQVDWGHLGSLEVGDSERKLWAFTFTLGYSRMMMAEAALDQKLGTLLRMHEEAFRQLGGVPEEILYDRMKTVWQEVDERGEIMWNPVFLDFARYWGFRPRLCRPYRAQTKGKVESGVKYLRRNFLCGLQGREPAGLEDLNAQLREWVWTVGTADDIVQMVPAEHYGPFQRHSSCQRRSRLDAKPSMVVCDVPRPDGRPFSWQLRIESQERVLTPAAAKEMDKEYKRSRKAVDKIIKQHRKSKTPQNLMIL